MEKIICYDCGKVIENEDYEIVDGEYICKECIENTYVQCYDCDNYVKLEDAYYIEDEDYYVCEDCVGSYERCEDCGNYVKDYWYIENFGYVCNSCFDNGGYYRCDHCDNYFCEDDIHYNEHDDSYYCDSCYEDIDEDALLYGYHDFCDWHLYKGQNEEKPKYYIGKEIELEPKNNSNLKSVIESMNSYLNAVGMHDGSLDYGSVEVVTHPESWQYLQEKKDNYKKFFEEINRLGYGDNGNAGLHFHVTRPNENVISRIIVILESFKDEIKKLSRRGGDWQWSKFITDINPSEDKKEKIKYQSTKYIKEKYLNQYHDRYVALNLNNSNTIEFRFFNGANNFEEYWSALQFIHNIMEVALNEERDLNTITWKELLIGEELQEQAKKFDLLDINKNVKDTTEILDKIEKVKEETKKKIKNTLKNFIKYMSKEMENKRLEIINRNDISEITRSGRRFINSLSNDLEYLECVTSVYTYIDEDGLNTTKRRMENLKREYNRKEHERYYKQIEKTINDYENEVIE